MTKAEKAKRDEAIAKLRDQIKPGDTLFTILRHTSRSGMMRSISVITDADASSEDHEPFDTSWLVAHAIGWTMDPTHGGIKVSGAGMDMGFHVVNTLSYVLYPEYECTSTERYPNGQRNGCPSAVHVNSGPDRDKYGAGVVHKDGYALKQRWL